MRYSEPLLSQHPWLAAVLLATVATPGGVVFAWLAPRPLDAIIALPLVLVDLWAGLGAAEGPRNRAPALELVLLAVGIVLTWVFYVLVARVLLWRVSSSSDQEE